MNRLRWPKVYLTQSEALRTEKLHWVTMGGVRSTSSLNHQQWVDNNNCPLQFYNTNLSSQALANDNNGFALMLNVTPKTLILSFAVHVFNHRALVSRSPFIINLRDNCFFCAGELQVILSLSHSLSLSLFMKTTCWQKRSINEELSYKQTSDVVCALLRNWNMVFLRDQ